MSYGTIANLAREYVNRAIIVEIFVRLPEEARHLLRSEPIAYRGDELREPRERSRFAGRGVSMAAFPPGNTDETDIQPLRKLLLAELKLPSELHELLCGKIPNLCARHLGSQRTRSGMLLAQLFQVSRHMLETI